MGLPNFVIMFFVWLVWDPGGRSGPARAESYTYEVLLIDFLFHHSLADLHGVPSFRDTFELNIFEREILEIFSLGFYSFYPLSDTYSRRMIKSCCLSP